MLLGYDSSSLEVCLCSVIECNAATGHIVVQQGFNVSTLTIPLLSKLFPIAKS